MRASGQIRQQWLVLLGISAVALLGGILLDSRAAVSASNASQSAAALDALIQNKSYSELERQLPGAKLTASEREYFQAVLDDHSNRPSEAIAAFEKILPELKKADARREALALRTLGYDYFMVGRYGDASDALSRCLKDYPAEFSAVERHTIEDDRDTFELFRGAPPQTISGKRTFTLNLRRDPLTNDDVAVQINGTSAWWLFDTGANTSVIALSTAKRLGLAMSKGHGSTQSGATGNEISLWGTVIHEMKIGAATVHNSVAVILEDKALNVGFGKNGHYQIEAILGYPVMAALGSFRFGGREIFVTPESQPTARSTKLYVET